VARRYSTVTKTGEASGGDIKIKPSFQREGGAVITAPIWGPKYLTEGRGKG